MEERILRQFGPVSPQMGIDHHHLIIIIITAIIPILRFYNIAASAGLSFF